MRRELQGAGAVLRIFDRYVMWQVLRIMLATIGGGILLLSLARMLLVIQSGASFAREFSVLVQLTVLFVPHYLGFMLPLALYWGSYTVVRRLSLNSELTALLAGGVSLARFTRPMMLLGVLVTLINVVVLGWLEPWARYVYREVRFQVENVSPYLAATEGSFMKVGAQTLLVERIDASAGTFDKIFLYEPKANGSTTEILASKGRIVSGEGQVSILLEHGTRLTLKPQSPDRPPSPEYLDFQTLIFPLVTTQQAFRQMGADEQEFSLVNLYSLLDNPPPGTHVQEMSSELNRKLVIILSSLFLPLLATSLARTNLRGKNALQGIISFGFLLVYQQLVQFGGILTDNAGISPAITMWPVFIALVLMSVTLLMVQDSRAGLPMERFMLAGNSLLQGMLSWFEPKPRRRRKRRAVHPPQRRPVPR